MPNTTAPLTGKAIREAFLRYFETEIGSAHAHVIKPSASLIPDNPTVLLTPAGMLPFVPIFLGIEPPPSTPRAVSVQKCARVSGKASDLNNVGRTPYHHTFFEMLGNFSFGDYFKAEMIPWAWEFVTRVLNLPPERLWVTVYETDDEAADIWKSKVGLPASRILRKDKKDNFWGPPGPTGPCGPCTEIHVDLCDPKGLPTPAEDPDLLDSERFIEIWNLVFMELFADAEGNTHPLARKNIDTGMGLERIAMVVQNKPNTFETDLLFPLVTHFAGMANTVYGKTRQTDVALKVLADHSRFVTFALSDGVTPSNEGRGYIARMILRRAIGYGKKFLGLDTAFFYQGVEAVCKHYGDAYPGLLENKKQVLETVRNEEERFFETLIRGSRLLEEQIETLKSSGKNRLPGDEAFRLYDTYGFPLELTEAMLEEEGLSLDEAGFHTQMSEQQTRARASRKGAAIVENQLYTDILTEVGPTRFLGYETLDAQATVKALIIDGKRVETVSGTNQAFEAILDSTPFYAESGGQAGDKGSFSREDGPHGLTVVVNDTRKVGNLFVHTCLFDNGESLTVGESLIAQVDPLNRQLAAMHHSATHLLHSALKKVLGESVAQAGSSVSAEGARFDFSFNRAVSVEELQRIEFLANKWIMADAARSVEEMDLPTAKQTGAIAMFGEKYGDVVRVITFGDASREVCGGTHVERLSQIGLVKIVSEGAIASGVRRLEFVAGEKAYKLFKQMETELQQAASLLKSPTREVPEKVQKLLETLKQQDKEIEALGQTLVGLSVDILMKKTEKNLLIECLPDTSPDQLRYAVEQLRVKLPQALVFLASAFEGKALFACSVPDEMIKQGIQAGALVKQAATLCEGGGGGKPGFAQAGGKNPANISQALQAVRKTILQTAS